jgi:hypothetical protein
MTKIIKKGGKKILKITKAIVKGTIDTILPNFQNSFTPKDQAFIDEPIKYKFDFWRFFSAITIWILLLLVFLGKIEFSQIVTLLNDFINEILPK